MAAGFQVFNADGEIIFDLSDTAYVIYGSGDTGYSNGSISDPNITNKCFIFVYYTEHDFWNNISVGDFYYGMSIEMEAYPLIKITSGKISWSYNGTMYSKYNKVRYKFFYGGPPID